MRRIVLAAVVAGWGALIATPGLAQTNEACMLRCLDHLLYQTCQARCTKGGPPSEAPTIRRAAPPKVAPAAASPAPAAVLFAPPSAPQPAAAASAPVPPALYPGVAQPAPQPSVQPPVQPAADQAPPPRPVNEQCMLRCLDHGRLYGQCEAVCAR